MLIAVFSLAACGGNQVANNADSTADKSSGTKNTSVDSKVVVQVKKDLCKLVPIEKVSEIMKVKLTKTEQKFADDKSTILDCTYKNDGEQSANVIVNYDNSAATAKEQFNEVKTYALEHGDGEPLIMETGVGQEAFYTFTGIITQLNVLSTKGDAWLTLTIGGQRNETDGKEMAKAFANAVWSALN